MGVIDRSVLWAGSLLFAFAALPFVVDIVNRKDIKISHKDTHIKIDE
ncbi:MAG: hypothetical protein HUJ63_13390 [Enterococcus sp.]|nr:hypothetical protein [Enterococcus sp.]